MVCTYRALDAFANSAVALVVILSPVSPAPPVHVSHFAAAGLANSDHHDMPESEHQELRIDNSSPAATGTGSASNARFGFDLAAIDPTRAAVQAAWNGGMTRF